MRPYRDGFARAQRRGRPRVGERDDQGADAQQDPGPRLPVMLRRSPDAVSGVDRARDWVTDPWHCLVTPRDYRDDRLSISRTKTGHATARIATAQSEAGSETVPKTRASGGQEMAHHCAR